MKGGNFTKLHFCVFVLAGIMIFQSGCSDTDGKFDMFKQKKDIVATASDAGNFGTLVTAIKAADLTETLQGEGPFTVFAPTDAAFAKLPEGTLDDLLKPENKHKLRSILTYHVVSGEVMADDVVKLSQAKTVNGQVLPVMTEGDTVMVGDAKVVDTDIKASNGVIHVIDTVLIPE